MKGPAMLAALLALLGCSGVRVRADDACPRADLGETLEDCPWAGVARALADEDAAGRPVEPVLARELPRLIRDLAVDAGRPELTGLWGRSINFDEGARGTIVLPALLDLLASHLGVQPRQHRVVHAGMEHTYGYLFSNLPTPFGYKRARWVREDIEAGFGLPRGTLGPEPSVGTLLGNVTYFSARLAGIPIRAEGPIAAELTGFDYGRIEFDRLTETLDLAYGHRVEIRTDLIPFARLLPGRSNTRLLIHSAVDSRVGHARLITVFPVEEAFVERVLNPSLLGDDQPISTRYNAWIEGVTGANPPPLGTRAASRTRAVN